MPSLMVYSILLWYKTFTKQSENKHSWFRVRPFLTVAKFHLFVLVLKNTPGVKSHYTTTTPMVLNNTNGVK